MLKLNKQNIRGSSIIVTPIVLTISMIMILLIGVYVINLIQPFIWHEKLNTTALKYMFIIEKYGYLTSIEKENIIKELKSKGFDTSNITIEAPESIKNYGELIEFKLSYKMYIKNLVGGNDFFGSNNNLITISISKNSYCKR